MAVIGHRCVSARPGDVVMTVEITQARLGGKADPTATVMSLALLLDFVGEEAKAERVEAAVEAALASRGSAVRSTSQIGDALAAAAS